MMKAARAFPTIGILSALCAASHVSAEPATTLAGAKTIQVQETFLAPNAQNKLIPYARAVVRIVKPNKVFIDMTELPSGGAPPKHLFYFVSDGKSARQYDSQTNAFVPVAIPAPGQPYDADAYNVACLRSVLVPQWKPDPATGVTRATSSETLEGQAFTVITDTSPWKPDNDGNPRTGVPRKWIDPKTGRIDRLVSSIRQGGKTTVDEQVNFTDWALNEPIPASQFAWKPPAGAKPYKTSAMLGAGALAPDFTAIAPDGSLIKLSDCKGKIVVLDFWATWCGPCQAAMPHLDSVYR